MSLNHTSQTCETFFFVLQTLLQALTTLWFALLSAWLAAALSTHRKRMRTCLCRPLACVWASIVNQHGSLSMPDIPSVSFFYTLLTMFGFFIGFYLTSMIKTEMVVVDPPITVESYDDLIRSGKRPVWSGVETTRNLFEFADEGSKEREIWKIAERVGLNQSIVNLGDRESRLKHEEDLNDEKEVALLKPFNGRNVMSYTACALSRSRGVNKHRNPLFRHDEGAKEILQGHVFNHRTDASVVSYINNRLQLLFEAHLLDKASEFVDLSPVFGSYTYEKYSEIAECYSNVVTTPHPEFTSVSPVHYVSLFYLMTGLLSIATVLLLCEKLVHARKWRVVRPVKVRAHKAIRPHTA